jgi:hypothetical protein
MDFKSLIEKSGVQVATIGSVAETAADHLIDQLNETIPTIHALGLDVRDLHMELGLPPSVSVKLVGLVDNINVARIKELIAVNGEKKLLVTLLKALEAAYNIRSQLKDLKLAGIEIDLEVGLMPKVHVAFVNA